tara:strand:+ start:1961 stop:2323 length:363 start_codon:yes stop_codon:yes gene_type:complete
MSWENILKDQERHGERLGDLTDGSETDFAEEREATGKAVEKQRNSLHNELLDAHAEATALVKFLDNIMAINDNSELAWKEMNPNDRGHIYDNLEKIFDALTPGFGKEIHKVNKEIYLKKY